MIQPSTAGSLVGRENEVSVIGLEWAREDTALAWKTFARFPWVEVP